MRDALHLLPPGFRDNDRFEYCPECAEVWGLLAYYPGVRETLDIIYEPLAHPRPRLVAQLGEGRWNCPTLILDDESPFYAGCGIETSDGLRYIDSARNIGRYWAQRFGTAVPRGTGPL